MTATLARLATHPNRSKKTPRQNPTPAEIRRAREEAGLTLEQAAALVYAHWRTWQHWESAPGTAEHRQMHPATWELVQVKLAAWRALDKGQIAAMDIARLGLNLPNRDSSAE